ncbi:hypothetical protein D3C78_1769870 [compost metagenome]
MPLRRFRLRVSPNILDSETQPFQDDGNIVLVFFGIIENPVHLLKHTDIGFGVMVHEDHDAVIVEIGRAA